MKLTRAQRRMAGVLGLAVAALLVDSAFLRPASVAAGVSPHDESTPADDANEFAAPVGSAEQAAAGVLERRRGSVAAQLERLAAQPDAAAGAAMRNDESLSALFAAPASWTVRIVESEGETVASQAPPTLELTSVLKGERPMAIVNGRSMRVGQTIEGYRLVAISERSVALEDAAGRAIVLHLRKQAR